MTLSKSNIYIFYVLLMGLVLFFIFRPVLANPEHYLYSVSGDGLKNYYTLTHYVKHDSGHHFSGMNYPYGEHIVFTDNQPILAFFLKTLHKYVLPMDHHIVGFLNVWMILALFLTGWFILLLLLSLGLPAWYALPFSILIALLSPQLDRFGGHFALSYGFFIPAILYSLWRVFSEEKHYRAVVYLTILYGVAGLTHLYYMAILLMLISSFVAFVWWSMPAPRPTQKVLLTMGGIASITLGIMAWLHFTDMVVDRPVSPYGVDFYKSSFESVFLPHLGPVDDWLQIGNQQWEGWNYVGLFGLGLLVALSMKVIVMMRRPKSLLKEFRRAPLLYATLFSGVVALLYSTHFFHWLDVFGILKHLGPLGQFRSIGRFGWVFYYAFLIYGAYYLHRYFVQWYREGMYNLAFSILLGAIVITQYEMGLHVQHAFRSVFNPNTHLTDRDHVYQEILARAGKKPADFQAILMLPYVILGPEIITLEAGIWPFREAVRCSDQTGLPIMNIMMSRTSIRQSLDLMGLLGDLPIPRERLKYMDDRSILLIVDPDQIREVERPVVTKAHLLGHNREIGVYALPVDSLRTRGPVLAERYRDLAPDTTLIVGPQGYVFYDNYEGGEKSPQAFNGTGAVWREDTALFCVDIPTDSQYYEMSVWMYIDPVLNPQPLVYNDYSDGHSTGTQLLPITQLTDVKGYWARYRAVVDSDRHLCLRIKGGAWVDAALVRPLKSHIVSREAGRLYYDNCPLSAGGDEQ